MKERAEAGTDDFPETGFAGLTQRFDLFKPVVALVNGDAIGGGLEIVLACDLALSVSHARFGLPEPRIGLAAFGGITPAQPISSNETCDGNCTSGKIV